MTSEITKLISIFWSTARSKADVCYFLYGDKMMASSWTAKLKEQPLARHECSFATYLPSVYVDLSYTCNLRMLYIMTGEDLTWFPLLYG